MTKMPLAKEDETNTCPTPISELRSLEKARVWGLKTMYLILIYSFGRGKRN